MRDFGQSKDQGRVSVALQSVEEEFVLSMVTAAAGKIYAGGNSLSFELPASKRNDGWHHYLVTVAINMSSMLAFVALYFDGIVISSHEAQFKRAFFLDPTVLVLGNVSTPRRWLVDCAHNHSCTIIDMPYIDTPG